MKRLWVSWNAWSSRQKLFVAVVTAVVLLDQLTKLWAVGALTRAFETYGPPLGAGEKIARFLTYEHPLPVGSIVVIDGLWQHEYAENRGSAFSFLASTDSSLRTPFLLVLSVVALVFIVVYYRRTTARQWALRLALALVFGGAVGNFIDRVRFGYVIDFIKWHWYEKAAWPTFNVADAAISVGVGLMLLDMVLARQTESVATRDALKAKGG